MEIRLLPPQEVDIEEIYTFCKQLIEDYETDPIPMEKVLTWCHRKIQQNLSEYRVFWINGQKVGYLRCCPPEDGVMELDDFYILEDFRGKGIGSAVLRQQAEQADQKSLDLRLYVFKKNEAAVRLYQRFGFHIVEEAGNSRWIMLRPHA